jgi:hypothetical protein
MNTDSESDCNWYNEQHKESTNYLIRQLVRKIWLNKATKLFYRIRYRIYVWTMVSPQYMMIFNLFIIVFVALDNVMLID